MPNLKHWKQTETLADTREDFFDVELTENLQDFIVDGTYKEYYNDHIVVETRHNCAKLFNQITGDYICIGFFNNIISQPNITL
jgi:hypothetical protein